MDLNRPPAGPMNRFCPGRAILILAAFFMMGLSGCMVVKPDTDPAQDQKAVAQTLAAREYNSQVTTSKGVGRLVLDNGSQREAFKMAWAAQAPNRLRLTLLLSGHPVETIAASGDKVTFVSHTGKHKPHTTVSSDPSLKPYIGVPIRLSEMIAMFLGRIPIRPFDRAWMSQDHGDRILANKDFASTLQEIQINDLGQVVQYRLLDKDRAPIYGVAFTNFEKRNKAVVPTNLLVHDAAGNTIEISLSGLKPNAPVKESMFRLTGPGS